MKYCFASLVVEMNIRYEPLKSQSIPYEIEEDKKVDVIIPLMDDMIKKYHELYPQLSIGDCEYVLYGAYFYKELLKHKGILLHSSCVVKDNYAYLFSAPSGTGKSTHTSLWLQVFKDAKILNDDKPAILIKNDKIYVCGTPFSGKTNLNLNEEYEIKGIAFLERSKDNWIKEMDVNKSIYSILNQTIRPDDEANMDLAISTIEEIVKKIKIYKFGCNISEDAVYTSYAGMNK